jgi:mRNA interferase MazF
MSRSRSVRSGDVLVAALPSRSPDGHEQVGTRPVVVVAVPVEPLRYPVIVVVPLTTREDRWATANPSVYVGLSAGAGGLPFESTALLDQIGSIDVRRIQGYLGTLGDKDSAEILIRLRSMFEQ